MSTPADPSVMASASGTMSSMMGLMGSVKEKWDASGGNEAISRISASIPQGTKDTLGSAAKNLFNKDHLRSLTVFFGIGEERSFYLEKSPSLLTARLRHNFTFFYLNYMVVFGVLFILTMITSITTMIGLVALGGAWLYVIRASSEGYLQIASVVKIPQKQATIGMAVVSAIVLFYLLRHIFWWTVGSGGFLVLLHSFFRDASMHQDQDDRVEMHGDLSLDENAAFLNPVEGSPVINQV